MRNRLFGLLLVLSLLVPSFQIHSQSLPAIEFFSPQNAVKDIRQVSVRFTEPMVPFGAPNVATEIFDISCPEKGAARWADERNWIYDFDRDLPAGVRCEFRLKRGTKALSGRDLGGQLAYSFSTGGPAVRQSFPYEGDNTIDEEQIFILELDAEATDDSVASSVTFSIEGIVERVGARVITGRQRADLLRARYSRGLPADTPFVLIQARQRFPADSKVSLVWGKGVRSKRGVATETEQVLPFKTRAAFNVTFRCQRENPQANCIPLLPMTLSYGAPVARARALQAVLRSGARSWRAEPTASDNKDPFLESISFKGPFPEKGNFIVDIPKDLLDDAGRRPINLDRFPLAVRTDEYPPLAKFAARFGIIELNAEPALPVTLRNIEAPANATLLQPGRPAQDHLSGQSLKVSSLNLGEVIAWLRRVESAKREASIFSARPKEIREFKIPKLRDSKSFEVVGIPLKEPGFYVVEIASELLGGALIGKGTAMYVPAAALVTNLSVHFKWGHESSLVWVTSLDRARPVANAQIQIVNCLGQVIWSGASDASGIARVSKIPTPGNAANCGTVRYGNGLFVFASAGSDLSFIHSSWDDGIEPWRFQLPTEYQPSSVIAHTILDRALFRAGETVRMKHIIRNRVMAGFAASPVNLRPTSLTVEHVGSDQKYQLPLKWEPNGSAESSWAIPKDAKLGTYQMTLKSGANQLSTGEFRVEEFRLPVMKGTIQTSNAQLVAPSQVPVDLSVRYLAGGGAAHQTVKLRSRIEEKKITLVDDYEGFSFANGAVKEGVARRSGDEEFYPGESFSNAAQADDKAGADKARIRVVDLKLDKSGTARATIGNLPALKQPMEILAELEFNDPSGQVQTASTRVPLWPTDRMVGVKPDSWALSKDQLKFHVVVLDLNGKPAAGAPVRVELFERQTYAHRKRLVGGLYAYEQVEEIKKHGQVCSGKSDGRGVVICETKSPVAGNVILQAYAADTQGREATANNEVWVAGSDQWWFAQGDHDRMDLLPERKRYQPNETARLQVRMPFKQATALVTVEREGVVDGFVKELSGNEPVIELPLKGSYAPNVFVSVLAVRGRSGEVQPTATIDLGRPAYKLGIAEINVNWRAHELKVTVTPERQVFKVRDKARVKIAARRADGSKPPAGSEVAVAAVDEALLELMPNKSWDLLTAMMGRRSYSVFTSTAQMQVIGRRHFGLKALPAGGGGGKMITRELFDTLLAWRGRVELDANGEATVEIPLNDSLSSFRIAAVATGGVELFGSGAASIRTKQELMLFSGIAPLAREGDKLRAEFTVRNASERDMQVQTQARVRGFDGKPKLTNLKLAPGEAKEIAWEVQVPFGAAALTYEIEANEPGGAGDRLRVQQKAVAAVPLRTYQATIKQVEKDFALTVERPKDAILGRGAVNVLFRPKLADSLAGVTDAMRAYPYTCMEQLTSRAVALRNEKLWRSNMDVLPSYLDEEGMVKFFPNMQQGSETLTSYMLAIAHQAGWEIPTTERARMEGALGQFIQGKLIRRGALPTADLAIRKMAAIDALSRWGKADKSWLTAVAVDANLWPTSGVIDWYNVLQRIKDVPNREQRLKQAEQVLRSRLNFQGTALNFSTEKTDSLWWLLTSGDQNAVRLMLTFVAAENWQADMPRLAQGALLRQKRGAWDTTLANAWGVLAFEKFSQRFERVAVSGASGAQLGARSEKLDWAAEQKGKMVSLPWPAGKDTLKVDHAGAGKPWVTVQSTAAMPLKQPMSSGFKVTKRWAPVERKQAGRWSKGDIMRITLDLEAQSDMTWVVVDDPIPAGATILGSGLGGDSQFAQRGEKQKGWAWIAFQERSFEGLRTYYQYVPKGKWTLEYTVRFNQTGTFQLPTTRVEAMYATEMFGELPQSTITVYP